MRSAPSLSAPTGRRSRRRVASSRAATRIPAAFPANELAWRSPARRGRFPAQAHEIEIGARGREAASGAAAARSRAQGQARGGGGRRRGRGQREAARKCKRAAAAGGVTGAGAFAYAVTLAPFASALVAA